MPVTAVPQDFLSRLAAMQRQLDELTRAVGRPANQVRDINDNVIQMVEGADYPVLGAADHDVSVVMANGAVAVADGSGREYRPIAAETFYGPVQGDTTGVHHGDVGTTTEAHNHYGDLHGNSYGFHFGPVGDGTTQNQINAANIFATNVTAGIFYGDGGVSGSNFNYNGQFWGTLHGNVVAPSESQLKHDVTTFTDAGHIVDEIPAYRWRWRGNTVRRDDYEHAGPMVGDIAEVAPWLVRQIPGMDARGYSDRDLIGVLWGALRDARARITELERQE
jgi:hypothetical protein